MTELTTQERFKRGAADAGRYFQFMADFVGFAPDDAETIRLTRPVIEKHLPRIIGEFYEQLLSFPATRKHFLRKDGSIDEDYLELRMRHQANFWRRAAAGQVDEDFARFLDYVGRAHTSQGADPHVYIAERYVTGMVAFMQQRITDAVLAELAPTEPQLAARGVRAWNALLMVILELLSRAYGEGDEKETFQSREDIREEPVLQLAEATSTRVLSPTQPVGYREILVGDPAEIPEGGRKVIDADGVSIGVFRHGGTWYALQNSCLHRGGPVCMGNLEGDVLTCPWHGYQYSLTTGQLLLDTTTKLPMYGVELRENLLYVRVPVFGREPELDLSGVLAMTTRIAERATARQPNEFRPAELKPGQSLRVEVADEAVAVYNVDGTFYATADACTHASGPMSEGVLEGTQIICPWHASCFDVRTGAVLCGPADEPLQVYAVVIDGDVGRVEPVIDSNRGPF